MPNSKHNRHHRQKEEDAHNNNQAAAAPAAPQHQPREIAAGAGQHGMAHGRNDNNGARLQKCCAPTVCRYPEESIDPRDPCDAVKVICNNEQCDEGVWMHKDCFDDFQTSVLAYLRSCGRARSWSEKQRLQNLWTKKGYDLAFKACDCKCGRGHLRKDLDYFAPPPSADSKKAKKHKKKNDKPMPVVSTAHKNNSHSNHVGHLNNPGHAGFVSGSHPANHTINHTQHNHMTNGSRTDTITGHTKKPANDTTGMTTNNATKKMDVIINQKVDNSAMQQTSAHVDNHPLGNNNPTTGMNGNHIMVNNNNQAWLPAGNPQLRLRTNSVSSTGSVGSHSSSSSSIPSSAGSISPISASPVNGEMFFKGSRKASDSSGSDNGNGPTSLQGFRQRLDLSAFACLPRNKQNPYHIRIEDTNSLLFAFNSACSLASPKLNHSQALSNTPWEVAGAEDGSCDVETRNFVLTNLLNKRMCSTRCVLCKTVLPVFDRFPLIDGTFFLSPQSYDEHAIQVIWEGRLQFLNALCLGCLEGRTEAKCVACKRPWDGRNLVIGSMYTYDIFASVPCCQKRLTCKCCRRAVVDITRGLDFYSQYSHMIICPYCKANDYHFIRSLQETFLLSDAEAEHVAPICY